MPTPPEPPSSIPELSADLRMVLGRLIRRLREQADSGDLSDSQKAVVLRLERDGPATVTALAAAEGVRPQSMGATLATLEAAGHVESAPDPSDGRQKIVRLSAALRDRRRVGRAARQDWLSRTVQARLSPAEQAQLAASIALFRRLLDD